MLVDTGHRGAFITVKYSVSSQRDQIYNYNYDGFITTIIIIALS